MKFKPLPSQDELKRLFSYQDGNLIWLSVPKQRQEKLGKVVGCLGPNNRIETRINGVSYLLARLIYKWHTGLEPTCIIDHLDRDPTNNRIENLSSDDSSGNNRNKGVQANNLVGHKNIGQLKNGKFRVRIRLNPNEQKEYTKCFKTLEEAIQHRNDKLIEFGYPLP